MEWGLPGGGQEDGGSQDGYRDDRELQNGGRIGWGLSEGVGTDLGQGGWEQNGILKRREWEQPGGEQPG